MQILPIAAERVDFLKILEAGDHYWRLHHQADFLRDAFSDPNYPAVMGNVFIQSKSSTVQKIISSINNQSKLALKKVEVIQYTVVDITIAFSLVR